MIYIYCAKLVFQDIALGLFNALKTNPKFNKNNKSLVEIVTHINEETDRDLYIMFGMNVYEGTILPKHYIVYQFEQTDENMNNNKDIAEINTITDKNWFTPQYIKILKGSLSIWDYSMVNIKNLKKIADLKNCTFKYVPVSYMPHLDIAPKTSIKDIDVLFFGVMNDRRYHVHDSLVKAGLNVHFADYNLWGAQRTELVNRSKICLNIHYYTNPILETVRISYLLAKKAFVISEKSNDAILDKIYSSTVVFTDYNNIVTKCIEYINNPSALNDFANKAYETFKQMPYAAKVPITYIIETVEKINPGSLNVEVEQNISDNNQVYENETNLKMTNSSIDQNYLYAETEQMDDGSQILKLPDISSNDLPFVSVVTLTYNRSDLFDIALRNYRLFKYPEHKLEWVILDDSNEKHFSKIDNLVKNDPRIRHIKLPIRKSVSEKRNIAIEYAAYDYIVFMDDDDYYLPESILARIKLLIKYQDQGINCVACNQIGIYNLIDNYSYLMDSKTPSEASMAFTRDFWKQKPFPNEDVPQGEGIPFIIGRTNQIVIMPYMYNFIAITHNKNITGKLRTVKLDPNEKYTNFFDLWDFNTQLFFIKIKRAITNKK